MFSKILEATTPTLVPRCWPLDICFSVLVHLFFMIKHLLLGSGGRIREGMSLSGFVVKQIALSKMDDSNPREAILKHAKVS